MINFNFHAIDEEFKYQTFLNIAMNFDKSLLLFYQYLVL